LQLSSVVALVALLIWIYHKRVHVLALVAARRWFIKHVADLIDNAFGIFFRSV
jgi:hypothetical protein